MKNLICWLFGHKIVFAPFLPKSSQNWYDTVCTRCRKCQTIIGGQN